MMNWTLPLGGGGSSPIWVGAVLFFAGAGVVYADCKYVDQGLKEKMQAYTTFRTINQSTLDKLLAIEASCLQQGTTASSQLATIAAAQACEAEFDASGIDKKMSEIGSKCTSHFSEINTLQKAMHEQFKKVQSDLQYGTKILTKSQILNEYCTAEVKTSAQMVQSFLALEGKVVAVQDRSLNGKVNYGKFTETSKNLQAATHANGESCGQLTIWAHALSGAVVNAGNATNSESDVTGLARANADDALAAGIMAGQGVGGGSKVAALDLKKMGSSSALSRVSGSSSSLVGGALEADSNTRSNAGGSASDAAPSGIESVVGALLRSAKSDSGKGDRAAVIEATAKADVLPGGDPTRTISGQAQAPKGEELRDPASSSGQSDPAKLGESDRALASPTAPVSVDIDLFTRINARYRLIDGAFSRKEMSTNIETAGKMNEATDEK